MIWWCRTIIYDQLTINHQANRKEVKHKTIKSQTYDRLYTARFTATWLTYGRRNASRSGSGECGRRSSKKPHRGCALPCPHAERGHACRPPGQTDTWKWKWETWSELIIGSVDFIYGPHSALSELNRIFSSDSQQHACSPSHMSSGGI